MIVEKSPDVGLLQVARRVVWFKPADETLHDPVFFLNHVMTYGTNEDLGIVRAHCSDEDLREALRQAHPGIFDVRSWCYWHVVLDMEPVPPLPVRRLPDVSLAELLEA